MRRGSRADGAVANLVRSGRKQPQRFRPGSFRFPPLRHCEESGVLPFLGDRRVRGTGDVAMLSWIASLRSQ